MPKDYHSKNNDASLWKGILNSDKKCFQTLFEKNYRALMLSGLGVRMDKEMVKDVIQETYLEIWNNRDNLPEVKNVNAYLKQIVKRKMLKKLAKASKQLSTLPPYLSDRILSYETLLIQQQENEAVRTQLQSALEHLTAKQKEIILLRFYERLSYEEIAEKMDTQKRTIYNQVHTAIKILKKCMLLQLAVFLTS